MTSISGGTVTHQSTQRQNLQKAHTHADTDTDFLNTAHLQVPDKEPGEDCKNEVGHGGPYSSKDGKVHNRHRIDTCSWNAVVPFLGQRSATDEKGDATGPHYAIDGCNASPDQYFMPALDSQA